MPLAPPPETAPPPDPYEDFPIRQAVLDRPIRQAVLDRAGLPFQVAFYSFMGLLVLILFPVFAGALFQKEFSIGFQPHGLSPVGTLLAAYAPHILLTLVTVTSAIIGYRIVAASGARADFVIPLQDYQLLYPLVSEGKAESIDQYVRLASLSGYTGTWTKLGLTGLPLATIALTLIFSMFAMINNQGFMDLAKLTLGAFIGSFVQRQVEQRREAGNVGSPVPRSDQSTSPPTSH
jgi:hypothetical protein